MYYYIINFCCFTLIISFALLQMASQNWICPSHFRGWHFKIKYATRTSADGILKLNMPLALPQMASQNRKCHSHFRRWHLKIKYAIRTSADGISKLNMPFALPQMASENWKCHRIKLLFIYKFLNFIIIISLCCFYSFTNLPLMVLAFVFWSL